MNMLPLLLHLFPPLLLHKLLRHPQYPLLPVQLLLLLSLRLYYLPSPEAVLQVEQSVELLVQLYEVVN